ncbi:hypothetical protein [Bathymodiolus japonicus methanotrophic gill symbiont]|uniref:hypothetical protein n=1 Tax=Bathymodiolus japonicus methanotrophic gill symbiont TaxID=113269 RepID=UPI001C8EC65F|nr:hypothetical protein [Bathymodiolus japonicus methanotrophic gill symbiont]
MRSRCGRRAFRASPIRCVGERIMATGVPEFREVAWRACQKKYSEQKEVDQQQIQAQRYKNEILPKMQEIFAYMQELVKYLNYLEVPVLV